ncbi:hypothetical protein ACFW04_013948 [Cataglyphis niger]
MNNAVFGKTIENVRNHVNVKLLTKWDGRYDAEAMIAKPNFYSRSVFSENLRYGPRVLAQHINDGKYVVVTSVETRVWTHLDDVSLPQLIVSLHYDVSSRKISSRRSMQFLNE